MTDITSGSQTHDTSQVQHRVHDGHTVHQGNLCGITDSERLGQINLHPARRNRSSTVSRTGHTQRTISHSWGSTTTEQVGQQETAIATVKVDQTVDRELDLVRQVPVERVLQSRSSIGRVSKPNAQLLQITSLTTGQRELEATIRTRSKRELYLLLGPALRERDGQGIPGHVKTTGNQISSIRHRDLGEVHNSRSQLSRDSIGANSDLTDDLTEVSKVNLDLHRGSQDVRRERESTTTQCRTGVGETQVDVSSTLCGICPIRISQESLTTQGKQLLLLTTVFAQSESLEHILLTCDVVKLAGTIAISDTTEHHITPTSRQSQTGTIVQGVRQLDSHDNLRKTLVRVERDRRTGA